MMLVNTRNYEFMMKKPKPYFSKISLTFLFFEIQLLEVLAKN